MHVTVLVGGKGTRLGEPVKCLTRVAGRPFLDWRLEQLREDGATSFTLLVGPFAKEFARYELPMIEDPQSGIEDCLRYIPKGEYWALGDVYLRFTMRERNQAAMVVTRNSPHPNIAGHLLDCGLYFGKSNFTLVETPNVPIHINTREDWEHANAHIR